ncbi:hypothetical protein [Blattabacterium cuenoti]|uniref:hypothetical protein n=1 Tax=Blattabacterium cuenoti TaxID=1653831 RepID=UPI00163B93AC|nr:hypothetical protein [Blattabacterium cuenoti]
MNTRFLTIFSLALGILLVSCNDDNTISSSDPSSSSSSSYEPPAPSPDPETEQEETSSDPSNSKKIFSFTNHHPNTLDSSVYSYSYPYFYSSEKEKYKFPPTPQPSFDIIEEKKLEQEQNKFFSSLDSNTLDIRIKELGNRIERLQQESDYHHDEYSHMINIQKLILDEMRKKKRIINSKTSGPEEIIKAKQEFEEKKKLEEERSQIIKEKGDLLNQINNIISAARKEEYDLKKIQDSRKEEMLNNHRSKEEEYK